VYWLVAKEKISTAKTDDEYRKRASRWYYAHDGKMAGFTETEGHYYKADGTKVKIRHALGRDKKTGKLLPESKRAFNLASASNQASVTERRKEKQKVPERLRSKFPSDEAFEGYKQYVKDGFRSNEKKRKDLNQSLKESGAVDAETGKPLKSDLGHVSSFGNEKRARDNPELVGSNDPMNQKIEVATGSGGNRTLAAKGDKPPQARRDAGFAVNWDEAVDNYLSSEHRTKYEILTPQDQQRILNGESADSVFSQRRTQLEVNPNAGGTSHNRKRMEGYLKNVPPDVQPSKLAQLRDGLRGVKPVQAVRAARGVSPLWSSLPLGLTAVTMSGKDALASPTVENIEDVGWDTANLVADAVSLIPIPAVVAGAEGAQKLLGVAQQARMGQRELAKQEGLPEPIQKFVEDPLNELEYAGKSALNFLGNALRMGSEAGY
jgi:hypothetical protein